MGQTFFCLCLSIAQFFDPYLCLINDFFWSQADKVGIVESRFYSLHIQGYLVDFQVKDADNDGDDELVVAVVAPKEGGSGLSGYLSSPKPKSNIFFFKLF